MRRLADRFVLERELGSGGMARVFLGRDEVLDRPVAVKVLKPMHGETDIGARFQREGRTAARLSHPNIVQVYDAGEAELDDREASFIVMEYLSGGDLKGLIDERGKLPGPELARIGQEVCSGLAHAHGRGIIHRDIKPHNILLDDHGRAKVSDFGIARALDTTQATRSGVYLGTALYSSPEQLQGHEITPKTDVYALGVTMYQAATGEPLFTGTPIEIASQHVTKPPPPLRERDPELDLGGDLEALILACLAKSAEDRPTAEQASSRFREATVVPEAVHEEEPPAPAPPPPRRERPRPAPTMASSGGGVQRRGRFAGVLAAVAILAVLLVVGLLALPNLLPDGGDTAQNSGSQNNQANAGGGSNQENGGGEDQAAAGPTTPAASGSAPASPEPEGGGGSGGDQQSGGGQQEQGGQQAPDGLSEEAAAQTVEEVYEAAASEEYATSYDLLSQGFKTREQVSQEEWAGTFSDLQDIQFVQGPSARVSGDTATVTGVTRAELTGETQRNTASWTLVAEDGEWKMDTLSIENQETL